MAEIDNLFPDGQTATVSRPEILPTPGLPERAYAHEARRIAGDPVGRWGLPDTRAALNALLSDLCDRLISAGGTFLRGKRLVAELQLRDTRSLRALVAYGHVHHRLRQIVGWPGNGYTWGDCSPDVYADMSAMSRRMGICFLFNSALYSRRRAVVELAQMCLEFAAASPTDVALASPPGQPPAGPDDEVSAWLQAERLSIGDVLEAMVTAVAATPDGRVALAALGARHGDLLVSHDQVAALEAKVAALAAGLADLTSMAGALRSPRQPATAP